MSEIWEAHHGRVEGGTRLGGERGQDRWAAWLASRRHGDDPEQLQRTLTYLAPIRDRVIANADLTTGDRVLDVGCGDGLIAFAALEAVGPDGSVIFSDISADLLQRCRDLVAITQPAGIVQFLQAGAADLSAIPGGSLDAVTLRSVLIYEGDKPAAFDEFHRVLRAGGRLSMFEPINRFGFPEPPGRFFGYDVTAVPNLAATLRDVYEAIQPPATDPMLTFDERDLLGMAERAGFVEVHLQLQADIEPTKPMAWTTFLHSSGNPTIPTLTEAINDALTPSQSAELTACLQPQVEQGIGQRRMAVAYLHATA